MYKSTHGHACNRVQEIQMLEQNILGDFPFGFMAECVSL